MRLPGKIKVGPHEYVVVRKTEEEMPDEIGESRFDSLELCLRKQLRGSKLKEILLHELLHLCTYPSFTGAYDDSEKLTSEDFVNAVAPLLLQVLQENPKLVEYLTK